MVDVVFSSWYDGCSGEERMTMTKKDKYYIDLIKGVGILLEESRKKVYYEVNSILVKTYWEIGRRIVEFEQRGKEKAEYGSVLLDRLSMDLKLRYGKGFSRRNLLDMRKFYLKYQKRQTLSAKLGWSHYIELLGIDDNMERTFYETECLRGMWSIRELRRQIDSALFHRLALSKSKEEILRKRFLWIKT